jgi:lambda family phage minor tail protein L
MTTVIREESQKPDTSELIELYTLDLTLYGDSVYYFTPNIDGVTNVVWQGNTYTPFDLEAEGFELDGRGSAPTPKIRFSLTNPIITSYIAAFSDLIGAKVTRCKTYKKFLDGEPGANPNAHYPLDIYKIERKASENRLQVEFELSSVMDQRGAQLPSRTITSFYCPWIYRRFNGGVSGDPLLDFDYHPADNACPYDGSDYFDRDNAPCAASEDKCNKTQAACKLRFGSDAVLPFGGFPGAARPIL